MRTGLGWDQAVQLNAVTGQKLVGRVQTVAGNLGKYCAVVSGCGLGGGSGMFSTALCSNT